MASVKSSFAGLSTAKRRYASDTRFCTEKPTCFHKAYLWCSRVWFVTFFRHVIHITNPIVDFWSSTTVGSSCREQRGWVVDRSALRVTGMDGGPSLSLLPHISGIYPLCFLPRLQAFVVRGWCVLLRRQRILYSQWLFPTMVLCTPRSSRPSARYGRLTSLRLTYMGYRRSFDLRSAFPAPTCSPLHCHVRKCPPQRHGSGVSHSLNARRGLSWCFPVCFQRWSDRKVRGKMCRAPVHLPSVRRWSLGINSNSASFLIIRLNLTRSAKRPSVLSATETVVARGTLVSRLDILDMEFYVGDNCVLHKTRHFFVDQEVLHGPETSSKAGTKGRCAVAYWLFRK